MLLLRRAWGPASFNHRSAAGHASQEPSCLATAAARRFASSARR